MPDIKSLITNLENKVEKLVDIHKHNSKEVLILKQTNNDYKQIIDKQKQTIKDLEEKHKILKLTKSISGNNNEHTHVLKLKINELIREIDKCVALLNK